MFHLDPAARKILTNGIFDFHQDVCQKFNQIFRLYRFFVNSSTRYMIFSIWADAADGSWISKIRGL
jgi:hypothetical protein